MLIFQGVLGDLVDADFKGLKTEPAAPTVASRGRHQHGAGLRGWEVTRGFPKKKSGKIPSLKLTANAPENGWLEYDRFHLGWFIFQRLC